MSSERTWRKWPSRNNFHLNGRLITGPDYAHYLATNVLLTAPEVAFLAAVIPDLFHSVLGNYAIIILCVNIYAWVLCFAYLQITAYSDPGIYPRHVLAETVDTDDPWAPQIPERKSIQLRKEDVMYVKWCETCRLYRPPRASHCSIWNCIGRRNYRTFLWFVNLVLFNCMYIAGFSILKLYLHLRPSGSYGTDSFTDSLHERIQSRGQEIVSIILTIFCLMVYLAVAYLSVFHCFLFINNISTKEHFASTYATIQNPFHRGWVKNTISLLCVSPPPAYIDPTSAGERKRVEVELRAITQEDEESAAE
ncbi:hypothetical protein PROFUN_05565 [Planoprotostelium fungivorum]|uniref:Palmitoyltransferase n=1 Tax=Planoprotostelium fungivorum TaxID=1890364 RepID=A0A2P6N064_9EUKA|nr:hypothetical protein PROFUN_05565 [Planoprotostelium fungivorum]